VPGREQREAHKDFQWDPTEGTKSRRDTVIKRGKKKTSIRKEVLRKKKKNAEKEEEGPE